MTEDTKMAREKMAQWVIEVVSVYRDALFAASEEILKDVEQNLKNMMATLDEAEGNENA